MLYFDELNTPIHKKWCIIKVKCIVMCLKYFFGCKERDMAVELRTNPEPTSQQSEVIMRHGIIAIDLLFVDIQATVN